MATIQEIAARAGTSVATVSHVINRTRFVSDELRSRVERAMEELGAPKQERRKITVGFLLRNYRCSFAEDLIDALHCCGDIHSREELSHRVVGPGDIEVVSILVKTEMTLQELKTYQKRYGLDYIILDYTVRLVQTRHHETVEAPIIFLNTRRCTRAATTSTLITARRWWRRCDTWSRWVTAIFWSSPPGKTPIPTGWCWRPASCSTSRTTWYSPMKI